MRVVKKAVLMAVQLAALLESDLDMHLADMKAALMEPELAVLKVDWKDEMMVEMMVDERVSRWVVMLVVLMAYSLVVLKDTKTVV